MIHLIRFIGSLGCDSEEVVVEIPVGFLRLHLTLLWCLYIYVYAYVYIAYVYMYIMYMCICMCVCECVCICTCICICIGIHGMYKQKLALNMHRQCPSVSSPTCSELHVSGFSTSTPYLQPVFRLSLRKSWFAILSWRNHTTSRKTFRYCIVLDMPGVLKCVSSNLSHSVSQILLYVVGKVTLILWLIEVYLHGFYLEWMISFDTWETIIDM